MGRSRVSVIGAGQVGATTAQRIAESELADVTLVDIVEGMPQGKSLDLAEASPILGADFDIQGSNELAAIQGSNIVVITAGMPRKPGMSRDDLTKANAAVVGDIAKQVASLAPDAIVVVITNPLDVMTYLVWKVTGFPEQRVFGMAGILDSGRFSYFVARELDVSVKDVRAMVLGGHGDAMLPLPRYTTVCGVPITELLPPERINAIIERTRQAGAEIVSLLKTGSAFYATSASAAAMVRSVLRDEKRILPCCTRLNGEYGLSDVFVGVPVKLASCGVAGVIELKLTDAELACLSDSARSVRENCEKLAV